MMDFACSINTVDVADNIEIRCSDAKPIYRNLAKSVDYI